MNSLVLFALGCISTNFILAGNCQYDYELKPLPIADDTTKLDFRNQLVLRLQKRVCQIQLDFPYSAGNLKDTLRIGLCTGTLLNSKFILTAAHCLDAKSIVRTLKGYVPPELSSLRAEEFCAYLRIRTMLSPDSGPEKIEKLIELNSQMDFAILQISGSSLQSLTTIESVSKEIKAGEELFILQYPLGDELKWDSGKMTYLKQEFTEQSDIPFTTVYYEDIHTENGSSGAGIFDTHGKLAAMHLDGRCMVDAKGMPYGFNMGITLADIKKRSNVLRNILARKNSE